MIQEKMSTYPDTSVIVEKEKFVLSAMLLKNGECIPAVIEALKPDDFYRHSHSKTFTAIAKIYLRGDIPNVLTLTEDLRKSGDLENIGGIEFIYSLAEYANTTAYVPQYCKDIKAAADNRRLVNIAAKIDEDAKTGNVTTADIIANATAAFSAITAETEQAQFSDATSYLEHDFFSDLEDDSKSADISTDFWNLDQNLSLMPGLYIFGAEPAMGKTTFIWQVLENLARQGCSCVYCSYEMSKKAMFRKSVARTIFNDDPTTDLTASNLHNNFKYLNHEMTIRGAVNKIRDAKLDLRVLELHGENIDNLIRKLTPLASTDKQLVVCIDYVQIVAVEGKDGKAAVDEVLRRLSVFQRDTNSIIFVVSSFNRAGYRQPITYASFKESGALEYSAVALLGLQLAAVNKITGKENAIELDKLISDALKAQPRQVILRCIKYRNGSNFDCCFNYFSAHDTFEPCDDFEDIEGPPETTKSNDTNNNRKEMPSWV